jgi:hypothetical protein
MTFDDDSNIAKIPAYVIVNHDFEKIGGNMFFLGTKPLEVRPRGLFRIDIVSARDYAPHAPEGTSQQYCAAMRPAVQGYKGKIGPHHATIEVAPHDDENLKGWCTAISILSRYSDNNSAVFFCKKHKIETYDDNFFVGLLQHEKFGGKGKFRVVVGEPSNSLEIGGLKRTAPE